MRGDVEMSGSEVLLNRGTDVFRWLLHHGAEDAFFGPNRIG